MLTRQQIKEQLKIAQKIETNWIVFTGPPSSGKTTSVSGFKDLGFSTCSDISRDYLNELRKASKTKDWIKNNQKLIQDEIFWRMANLEFELNPDITIILDYALPDNLAFLEMTGLEIGHLVLSSISKFIYSKVFIFEPLEFEEDSIRIEDKDFQAGIMIKLKRIYHDLGYNPIIVKKDSLQGRIDFIKSHMSI